MDTESKQNDSLIDYCRNFHLQSKVLCLSANTRSLYHAILMEFNGSYYPAEMILPNVDLMKISGIHSSSSFNRARQELVENEFIFCEGQTYRLPRSQKLQQRFRKPAKRRRNAAFLSSPKTLELPGKKDIDIDRDVQAPEKFLKSDDICPCNEGATAMRGGEKVENVCNGDNPGAGAPGCGNDDGRRETATSSSD